MRVNRSAQQGRDHRAEPSGDGSGRKQATGRSRWTSLTRREEDPKSAWIRRFQRRVQWGQFLHCITNGFVGLLFGFGSLVLVVKLLLPAFWPNVLWLALASVPIALVAWLVSRRSPWSRTESIALLDSHLEAGGLLMTLSEIPSNDWETHLPQADFAWRNCLPRFRPVRLVRHLSLPVLFAVAACFVPLREASPTPALRNTAGQQATEQLEEMLSQLEESSAVEDEEHEQLRQEIEKLADETEKIPLTHEKWEAVDALRERMRTRLESSALSVSKAQSALAALAKAGDDGTPLSLERSEQLEQDVLDLLKKMAENSHFANTSLGSQSELNRLLKSGKFRLPKDAKAREKLLSDLQDFLDQESDRLSELRKEYQPGGT